VRRTKNKFDFLFKNISFCALGECTELPKQLENCPISANFGPKSIIFEILIFYSR
jgi:hypothetical protein